MKHTTHHPSKLRCRVMNSETRDWPEHNNATILSHDVNAAIVLVDGKETAGPMDWCWLKFEKPVPDERPHHTQACQGLNAGAPGVGCICGKESQSKTANYSMLIPVFIIITLGISVAWGLLSGIIK